MTDQSSDSEALARRLLNSQGCKACHRFENDGGQVGPDLQGLGSRLNALQIRKMLVNPEHQHGESRLPDFRHLAEDEMDALVSFLATLP